MFLLELDAHGPCTQIQLATGLGCEPPTITLMACKLEAAGLITRRPSSKDGRATVVELTDSGRAVIPPLKEAWLHLAEVTVAELKTTSPDQLIAVLGDLAQSLYPCGSGARRCFEETTYRPHTHQKRS